MEIPGRLFDQDILALEYLVHDPDQLVSFNVLQTVQVPISLPRQSCHFLLLCRHGRFLRSSQSSEESGLTAILYLSDVSQKY